MKHFHPVLFASLIACLPTSLPAQGLPRQKINDPLAPGGEVQLFQISPDSRRVVYTADQDTPGVHEIYSVPFSGGGATKISLPLQQGGATWLHEVSPDGSTVVYCADRDGNNVFELYSVPITGGVSSMLSNGLPSARLGVDFRISPDGTSVVFVADRISSANSYNLYRVPIGGGRPDRIYGPLPVIDDPGPARQSAVEQLAISPDGSAVVYSARQDTSSPFELYSVPFEGGVPSLLSDNPIGFGDGVTEFQISADSSTVVYLQDVLLPELFSVPIDGGAPNRLNDISLFPDGEVLDFKISPDSSTVVYRADPDERGLFGLYRVSLGGGRITKINPSFPRNARVSYGFQISPDSSTVVYRSDQDTPLTTELYSIPLNGGVPTKLNSPLVDHGDVSEFLISPDGFRVIYSADQDTNNVHELYNVAISGGPSTKINAPLLAGREIWDFQISGDSSTVVYVADHDTVDILELHAVWIRRPDINLNIGRNLADAWRAEHFGEAELSNPWLRETRWGWDADPDGDGLSNLIEYAIGGLPLNTYNRELLEISDGRVVMHFPQRSDAAARGLNYVVEFSRDLENWSDVPPLGASDVLHEYRPPVDGFQVRVIDWPANETRCFARLRVFFSRMQLFPGPFPFLPNLPAFP